MSKSRLLDQLKRASLDAMTSLLSLMLHINEDKAWMRDALNLISLNYCLKNSITSLLLFFNPPMPFYIKREIGGDRVSTA